MNYTERKITVDAGAGYPVQGVLTLPDGAEPCPAVVLLQGSGPQDYDESVAMNKPFRDIARGLAERGIASIRFTKRTLTYPERIQAKLADLTVREECIDDALAAKSLIAAEPRVDTDRIFLLGHSLGGMLAPR
ncbi:MAG: alpha/beta hydrolase, partial [Oscillospiraceae bacterium]|nr:alpha/beta hydrolase [Oscillospiraceae bacterium]